MGARRKKQPHLNTKADEKAMSNPPNTPQWRVSEIRWNGLELSCQFVSRR